MNVFETININEINIHYWNRYKNFILNIKNKGNRNLKIKETHHIIPKSINKNLEYEFDNLIDLTLREHYIAHKILSKCFYNLNYFSKMNYALWCMMTLNKKLIINSKDYEKTKIIICKQISNKIKRYSKNRIT